MTRLRRRYSVPEHMTELLARVVADAPNLLPRIVRYAPDFFAGRLRRPVFLLGCPRSGKTVLAEALGRHPELAHFPDEANRLWHPHLYPWRDSPLRQSVPPLWADPGAFAAGANASRTRADVLRLKASFGAYQMLLRRPALLVESALIAFQVPFIRSAFPDARIIHMVRDGRAVASAWARRQHAQMQQHEDKYRSAGFLLEFDDVLDRCASSWNSHILELRDRSQEAGASGARSIVELSYESFCDAPHDVLRGLAAELELDHAPFASVPVSHIQNRNPIDIATVATDGIRRIESRMQEALRLHGYIGDPA
jgi:hypothetical protein